jgi:hypothetical protein
MTSAGFSDPVVTGLEETINLGGDADQAYDWAYGLLSWMLEGLDENSQHQAQRNLRATIDNHHGKDGVRFGSAVWLVTARNPATNRSVAE